MKLQVIVLSEGHQLYFGVPDEAVDWFGNSLGYTYSPGQDGAVSDWLMDLVSVGFSKHNEFGTRQASHWPPLLNLSSAAMHDTARKLAVWTHILRLGRQLAESWVHQEMHISAKARRCICPRRALLISGR